MLQVHREKEGSNPWASNSGKLGVFTVIFGQAGGCFGRIAGGQQ